MIIINVFFVFLVGTVIGSFLNVIIYRLPRKESLSFPPSHCPECGHRLGVLDLIPLFSYLFLLGKCRYCKGGINLRYILVEFLTGILTTIWWLHNDLTIDGFAILFLTYILIIIAFIDLDFLIIPDVLSLLPLLVGLIVRFLQGEFLWAIADIFLGGGLLFFIALVFPKGMGMGDAKLLAMVAVFLGWEKALLTLFAGSALGTIIILVLIVAKRTHRKEKVPFGPYLVIGALSNIYWPIVIGLTL